MFIWFGGHPKGQPQAKGTLQGWHSLPQCFLPCLRCRDTPAICGSELTVNLAPIGIFKFKSPCRILIPPASFLFPIPKESAVIEAQSFNLFTRAVSLGSQGVGDLEWFLFAF